MGIVPKFGDGAIKDPVKEFHDRLEKATVFLLSYLGEDLVKFARENHTYTDRTGNLTNSMGYAVVKQGKMVTYSGNTQPGVGASEGLKIAMQMAQKLPNSYSLIIVAGMNYAAYVEAKGYNVILPAQLRAYTEFPKTIQRLTDLAKKKATEIFGNVL